MRLNVEGGGVYTVELQKGFVDPCRGVSVEVRHVGLVELQRFAEEPLKKGAGVVGSARVKRTRPEVDAQLVLVHKVQVPLYPPSAF